MRTCKITLPTALGLLPDLACRYVAVAPLMAPQAVCPRTMTILGIHRFGTKFQLLQTSCSALPAHPSAIQVSWCQALRHRTPSCPPCCPRHECRCCLHFAARRCHQAWHQRPSPKVHESRRSRWWLPGALDPPWPKLFSYHWWHYLKVPHQWQISCFHPSGFARLPWVALGHQ